MSIKQSISIVVSAVIGGIVGAGIVLSEVKAQAKPTATAITATSLDIVDSKGATRCRISTDSGDPTCEFLGQDGSSRLKIGLHGAGAVDAPKLTMTDSKGVDRLTADVEMISGPAFSLFDKQGTPRVSLSASKFTNDAGLSVYGEDFLHSTSFGMSGGSPSLALWDGVSSTGGGASMMKGAVLGSSHIVFVDGSSKAGFTAKSGANKTLELKQIIE